MYVCLCEAVTDQQIVAAVAQGCTSVPELRTQLGCGAQCGRCVRTVRDLLRQQRRHRHHDGLPTVRSNNATHTALEAPAY